MTDLIKGRTWLFPEPNINTDLIMPGMTFRMPLEEQVKYVFSANRPGWSALVQPGEIVVGGPNFGTGSARPAAWLFRHLGVALIVADSFSDLFLRNCVNYAMPSLICPGISSAIVERDVIEVDVVEGTVRIERTGVVLDGQPLPALLRKIIDAGGLMEQLMTEGYVTGPAEDPPVRSPVALPRTKVP